MVETGTPMEQDRTPTSPEDPEDERIAEMLDRYVDQLQRRQSPDESTLEVQRDFPELVGVLDKPSYLTSDNGPQPTNPLGFRRPTKIIDLVERASHGLLDDVRRVSTPTYLGAEKAMSNMPGERTIPRQQQFQCCRISSSCILDKFSKSHWSDSES